jgi:hypothetical protein
MARWADYGISAVGYNPARTYIVRVRVHEDKGDSMGPSVEWARQQVVSAIDGGKTFVTILRGSAGHFRRGKHVHSPTVGGEGDMRSYGSAAQVFRFPEGLARVLSGMTGPARGGSFGFGAES